MRISSINLQGGHGRPALEIKSISAAVQCYLAPAASGKSVVADFLAHLLFGKLSRSSLHESAPPRPLPEGDVVVESPDGRFLLRHYRSGAAAGRLTISSCDQTPVDDATVQKLLGRLSPAVTSRLFAIDFHDSLKIGNLLTDEFAKQFRLLGPQPQERRLAELAARRDELAKELENRLGNERRASHTLDQQSRDLDRRIQAAQQETSDLAERLKRLEASLAETDARLRYRRLELNTQLRWNASEIDDTGTTLVELDEEIARLRTILAEFEHRESALRLRIAQVKPTDAIAHHLVSDQRAWLAVTRQLAMDLEGEVARLARASASSQCACGDSHPRLRPIVETVQRQLGALESLIERHDRSLQASDMTAEAEDLTRSRNSLREHLDRLLSRRQALSRSTVPQIFGKSEGKAGGAPSPSSFSEADAEQLEERRMELEKERFALVEKLRTAQRALRDLKSRRSEFERQRAALLSVRSIEHIQREMADIQRRIESLAAEQFDDSFEIPEGDNPKRASDYLAQLTGGKLVRLQLVDHGRDAAVVDHTGRVIRVDELPDAERDQVYLSLSFALVGVAARHGILLPLLLDEPFKRLDAPSTAALAAVLDHFAHQGHQVIVFTSRRDAADRLSAIGCAVAELADLREDASHNPVASPSQDVSTLHLRSIEIAEPVNQINPRDRERAASPPVVVKTRMKGNLPTGLELSSNVASAPSIGPKTAQRLANAGIGTVGDLLAADPVDAARRIASRQIKADTIRAWQREARLIYEMPRLSAKDAKLIVACGIASAEEIESSSADELLQRIEEHCNSAEGQKVAAECPNLATITAWINCARHRRDLNAA